MMQKSFFLFLFCWTTINLHAQFSIGPKIGMNITSLYGDESNDHNNYKLGLQIGLSGEYQFNETWALQSGVLYSQCGAMAKMILPTSSTGRYSDIMKMVTNLNYLRMPVNAMTKIPLGKSKLLFQAGPYLGYGIGGKNKIWINDDKITGSQWKAIEDELGVGERLSMGNGSDDLYKAFDFGLGAGIGIQLGRHFQFLAEGNLGLIDIANDFTYDGITESYTDKNYGFSISLICFLSK